MISLSSITILYSFSHTHLNNIDLVTFKVFYWKTFYGYMKESVPPDAPKPLVNDADLQMYDGSDNYGDDLTRCSRTVFVIY